MSADPRCKNCVFWEAASTGNTPLRKDMVGGQCYKPEAFQNQEPPYDPAYVQPAYDYDLFTGPEFGCVHFEEGTYARTEPSIYAEG